MSSGSIIIFGILSAILLVFSCITLNAAKFYNEVELTRSSKAVLSPTLILRDRNFFTLENVVKGRR